MGAGGSRFRGGIVRLSDCTIVDSGIDWVTLTTTEDEPTTRLQDRATALARQMDECGNILGPWAKLGYVGWKCGTVAFGKSAQGGIVVCSGPDAGAVLRQTWGQGMNCTRLDMQTTVRYTPARPDLASTVYQNVQARKPMPQRLVSANLILGSDGGSTCYVGARQSEYFGRVYNKGVESKDRHYLDCWRFECELKGGAARDLAPRLVVDTEWKRECAGLVYLFFQQRGHRPDFRADSNVMYSEAKRTRSDVERRLRWLADQVSPTVNALRARGLDAEVNRALGLDKTPTADPEALRNPLFGNHADQP
jgi:hypothetical protein